MKIEYLSRYGLPDQLLRRWRIDGVQYLLPIQIESVTRYGILEKRSLIICGPGTSGKTFCGELAAAATVCTRNKALFLEPLKAIAEEKFRLFKKRYGPLGMRVKLSTRDHAMDDRDIGAKDFDIAILIHERFNTLTATDISLIKNASCFVIDEFQSISDPKRGIELELAVAKIRKFNASAQMIMLVGGGTSPERISEWLGLPVLNEARRPVDLRLGVLHRGTFHFREFNGLREGNENLVSEIEPLDDSPLDGQNLAAIKYLASQGEQILIFTRSRKTSVQLAQYLAALLDLGRASNAIKMLMECPQSIQNETLEGCLRSGVAFHHAELDEYQRKLVEDAFRAGEVRILSSTSTLATGVNLPARNVFIETLKYTGAKTADGLQVVPFNSIDFHQAAGRAGRFGSRQLFGRAILTATTPYEQEILWDKYVYGRNESPVSGLSPEQLPEFALRSISCRAASDPCDLETLVGNTYAAVEGKMGNLPSRIESTLISLEKAGLIKIKNWGKIEPTPLGAVVSAAGLGVSSALTIHERLIVDKPPLPLEWLIISLGLSEWQDECAGYRCSEPDLNQVVSRIHEVLGDSNMEMPPVMSSLQNIVNKRRRDLLAGFLFALEWCGGRPTRELEILLGKGAGGLKRDALLLAWLMSSIDRIARFAAAPSRSSGDPIPGMGLLIEKLRYGVDDRMLPLAKALGIDREFVRILFDNGIKSCDELYSVSPGSFSGLLPQSALARISKWHDDHKEPEKNLRPSSEADSVSQVIFTGNNDRNKFEVKICQRTVFLQQRLNEYLQKLWRAHFAKSPWVHKDLLDKGQNQARYISKLRRIFRDAKLPVEIICNGRGSYALKFEDEQSSR